MSKVSEKESDYPNNPITEWARKQSIMWYGVGLLPRLRRLSNAELKRAMHEAEAHAQHEPSYLAGAIPCFAVPTLFGERRITGMHVIAVLVFGFWVFYGETPEMAAGLMGDWEQTIMQALTLAPKDVQR